MALVWSQINTNNTNVFSYFVLYLPVYENFFSVFYQTHLKFCFHCSSRFTTTGSSPFPEHSRYFLSTLSKVNNQRKFVVARKTRGSCAGNINACPLSGFVMINWYTTLIMILDNVVHNIDNKIVIRARYWLDPHPSHYSAGSNQAWFTVNCRSVTWQKCCNDSLCLE